MLQVAGVGLRFGDRKLFEDVNIKSTEGNCYGLIGANGAGKSAFLKMLSGELDSQTRHVSLGKNERLVVLEQDHYAYENERTFNVVIEGHEHLYEVMKERDEIYMKSDFNDEDGIRATELGGESAEMNGQNTETDAANLLSGLGIDPTLHDKKMAELEGSQKIKVLLAQSLFGEPDVLLLDEPTNGLDIPAISWLEDFLINFNNTVIVVSHDRHFLNNVCTHIADLDFGKIEVYAGNYDLWYQSSQLAQKVTQEQNEKKEEKMKELQDFIARLSASAFESKQATSRKKQLEKIKLDDIQPSSGRYPFVRFTPEREIGDDLSIIQDLSKTIDGEKVLDNVSFTMNPNDKAILIGDSEIVKTALLKILAGEMEPGEGSFKWSVTTSLSYFPKDNSEFFEGVNMNLADWLRQYAPKDKQTETLLCGFLGRILFSGEEVKKKASVLSGGEKVRCMLNKMMLSNASILLPNEPANRLDLESITAVNDSLKSFKGSIIFTSYDFKFINTIANRVIDLNKQDGVSRETPYEEYLQEIGVLK